MALTGLQIYKLLPGTNCRECGFPTCLAFAMKLAAKQVELADCPYVTDEAKAQLEAAAAPPIRLIVVSSDGRSVEAGNETVLFRHEKTFYHKPGLFVRLRDTETAEAIQAVTADVEAYAVEYVGIDLSLDGLAIEAASKDSETFSEAIRMARAVSKRPLVLMSRDPEVIGAGLAVLEGEKPLIHAADAKNWEEMAQMAAAHGAPLAVRTEDIQELTELTERIKDQGAHDLVLDLGARTMSGYLEAVTQLRRLALQDGFRAVGYPIIAFPGEGLEDPCLEVVSAVQAIAKYAGFVVLEGFNREIAYPLLVWRENVFTDPQKPIQVKPGLYEINSPTPESPLLVTTNFSITYFSVANEVDGAGIAAWLLVADAEGMSVLTAWAAGKFDAETIARAVSSTGAARRLNTGASPSPAT